MFNVLKNVDRVSRSFVVCVWGQRSSDQNDYVRETSHKETCFQDPQSCAWLVIRSNQFGPTKLQIMYIHTKNQLADILTKGNFKRDERNHLLCLFNISQFSSTVCSEVMSKRTQKDSGEERVTAKSRPVMSLIARAPSTLSSSTVCGQRPKNRAWPSSQTIYWKLILSTLLKVGRWQSLVFSRVEIWQIDGWWNGATRCGLLGKDTRVPIKFLSWEDQARFFGKGNPLWTPKEEHGHSNSSLETTKQNWICR